MPSSINPISLVFFLLLAQQSETRDSKVKDDLSFTVPASSSNNTNAHVSDGEFSESVSQSMQYKSSGMSMHVEVDSKTRKIGQRTTYSKFPVNSLPDVWTLITSQRLRRQASRPHNDTHPWNEQVLQIMQSVQGFFTKADALNATLTPRCAKDLQLFEESLEKQEMWALLMADGTGKVKPGVLKGQTTLVGDYDQCRAISREISPSYTIVGQFCRLGVQPNASTFGLSQDKTAMLSLLLSDTSVHVCVPFSCSEADVFNLFQEILGSTGAVLTRERTSCVRTKNPTGDKAFWVALAVFACLAFLCVIGTIAGLVIDKRSKTEEDDVERKVSSPDITSLPNKQEFQGNGNSSYGHEHEVNKVSSNGPSTEYVTSCLASSTFSTPEPQHLTLQFASRSESDEDEGKNTSNAMSDGGSGSIKNGVSSSSRTEKREVSLCTKLILSFSVLKNGEKILQCGQAAGDLSCVHGVRVLSITWVILGHCFVMYGETQGNKMDAYRMMSDWTMMPIVSGTLSVDTFFLLSGLLTAYIFLRQVKKAGGLTVKAMVLYYFHRFWRLTPLYMLVLAYEGCIAYYTWLGPFDQPRHAAQNCKTYWWYNLLYINNFLTPDKLCMEWSWYLSNDMQFYCIAPLVLIPWAFQRKVIGCSLSVALLAVHVATTGYFVFRDNVTVWNSNNSDVFLKPWSRVGPFAIGLPVGYALYRTSCQYKIKTLGVLTGWTLAAAVGLAVVYLPYDNVKDVALTSLPAWGCSQNAAYEALSRPLWSAAVAWVVWACCTGHGGFVNRLLSWKAWVPLSRLSYGVYLLHIVVFFTFVKNTTDTYYVNAFTATEMFLCVTVTTFMTSFVFSLLIEAPTLGIEKALLGGGVKRRK